MTFEDAVKEQFTDCMRCNTLLPENLVCQQCGLAHGEKEDARQRPSER